MKIKGLYNNFRSYHRMKKEGQYVILYVDFKERDCWINEYSNAYSYTIYQNKEIVNIFALLRNIGCLFNNYQEFKNLVESIEYDEANDILDYHEIDNCKDINTLLKEYNYE